MFVAGAIIGAIIGGIIGFFIAALFCGAKKGD